MNPLAPGCEHSHSPHTCHLLTQFQWQLGLPRAHPAGGVHSHATAGPEGRGICQAAGAVPATSTCVRSSHAGLAPAVPSPLTVWWAAAPHGAPVARDPQKKAAASGTASPSPGGWAQRWRRPAPRGGRGTAVCTQSVATGRAVCPTAPAQPGHPAMLPGPKAQPSQAIHAVSQVGSGPLSPRWHHIGTHVVLQSVALGNPL